MNLFDLHCDTIGECYLQNKHLKQNDLHISLDNGSYLDNWCQLFAVWIPDEKRGQQAVDYFKAAYEKFQKELELNSDTLAFCKNDAETENALSQGKRVALLGVEGGAAANGSIEGIDFLYDCGVRLMTLTWNGSNEIANGCFSQDKGGLTPFGREAVKHMQQIGMIVDVSHLNERGFYDVAQLCEMPFVASHSNSDFVHHHPRNLTDDKLKVMAERECLIGLNLYNKFLGESEQAGCDEALRHAYRILEKCGEKALAMGTDYDGCTVADEIAGVDRIVVLRDYFVKHGLGEQCVENIFYNNAKNFFSRVLQK